MNFIERFLPFISFLDNPISSVFVLVLILGFMASIYYTIERIRNIKAHLNNENELSKSKGFGVLWDEELGSKISSRAEKTIYYVFVATMHLKSITYIKSSPSFSRTT